MKRLGIALLATVGFAAMAQAADLPTTKAPLAAPPPNCWASFWTWLNSSASDCPLSAYGITLYGTLDVNYGYQDWGAPRNASADKLQYGIRSNAYEHIWQAGFNGLSTSVVGLRMNESLAPLGLAGWSVVGVLEAGVNPYTGMFFNGPRSLADANSQSNTGLVTIGGKNYYYNFQRTNLDSSRAGQWDNSQGYVGISNATWGTLTFGRTNSLTYDTLAAYDPMAGSPAFSLLGFSSSFPGYGDTEIVRINTALTYKLAIPNVAGVFDNVRLAGQAQIGGYGVGNGAMEHYEGQVGFDRGNFSFDGIFTWAKDAVSASTFNGGSLGQCTLTGPSAPWSIKVNGVCYDTNDVLKATLGNIFGTELMASYKWDRFKFYGGYIYARTSNPSDGFGSGFQTMYPGIFVPPTSVTSTAYLLPNGTLSAPGFALNPKVLQTIWTGASIRFRTIGCTAGARSISPLPSTIRPRTTITSPGRPETPKAFPSATRRARPAPAPAPSSAAASAPAARTASHSWRTGGRSSGSTSTRASCSPTSTAASPTALTALSRSSTEKR